MFREMVRLRVEIDQGIRIPDQVRPVRRERGSLCCLSLEVSFRAMPVTEKGAAGAPKAGR